MLICGPFGAVDLRSIFVIVSSATKLVRWKILNEYIGLGSRHLLSKNNVSSKVSYKNLPATSQALRVRKGGL
jgi:hypothetical protein